MTITNLPPAPTRNDSPEVFSSKADASLGALPTFVTEANATISQVESDKLAAAASSSQASLYTTEAINSAQLSAANANYKGLWSAQTGAASVPYSVFHNGDFWVLVANIADVTASEPSDSNSDWRIAEAVPELRVPSAVQPLSGSTAVSIAPTLEASAYSPLYSVDARLHRRFEVTLAADTSFTSPVFTSEVDANSIVVSPALALETAHIWRCKDVTQLPDGSLLNSEWMATQDFTTAGIVINAPTLSVEGSPTSVPESPTLTAGAFDTTPTGQDTHASTDWEVRVTATSALVYTSAADAVNLTSIVVPAGILDPNTQYTFRVRYNGTTYGSSTFTEVVATTLETFDIVPLLAVSHSTSPFITIYNQEVDTFTKLDDPATLPEIRGTSVAFSSDDTYMVVGDFVSPFVYIYKRNAGVFTKLANPSILPAGTGNGVAFSSDDTYMAVAHPTSPYITIYKRSGDTFTKLANPASLPTGTGNAVAFSSDTTYMAVGHATSPFITIYKRSGDTFTKLANPATLPTSTGSGVAFSSDGTYLAVGHGFSPFITIYKRSGDTFTKLANPATLPTGNGFGVAFSSDDTYLALAHSVSPSMTIYKRSGDTFTKLANPATLPTSASYDVSFSSDTTYLAIGHINSPFITIYKRSGDTFTKLADPATLPTGDAYGVAFSNTGFPQ